MVRSGASVNVLAKNIFLLELNRFYVTAKIAVETLNKFSFDKFVAINTYGNIMPFQLRPKSRFAAVDNLVPYKSFYHDRMDVLEILPLCLHCSDCSNLIEFAYNKVKAI